MMEGPADSQVRLNVGGTLYVTTRATLCKEESFLSALVSGRHVLVVSRDDAAIFIDRDGPLFRHVLNYLRRGRLIAPPDDATLAEELLDEARFYQLQSLVQLLEPVRVTLPYASGVVEGLFFWLGTGGGTGPWVNPVATGAVRVRASKAMAGTPESVVGSPRLCVWVTFRTPLSVC